MINVFYKESPAVATGNRSRSPRGMRRSIRKIAVVEKASIAARKIIGARSLPVASRIFGTTACATKPPRLPTELIAANPAAAAAPVRKRPGKTQKKGWPAKIAAAAMHAPAAAQGKSDGFWAGKQVRLIIGSAEGGGYDIDGRG